MQASQVASGRTKLESLSVGRLPQRKLGLDAVKVIATYFVMVIHVSSHSFYEFSPNWIPTVVVDGFARAAVPMFLMATGALLLHEQHPVSSIWRRLRRVIVPLVAWSFIYLAYSKGIKEVSWRWLLEIGKGPVQYHLWYLYPLVGLYLFMPFCSGFYQAAKPKSIVFCLIVWFVVYALLPCVYLFTEFRLGMDPGYGLMGGYLVLGAFAYDQRSSNWLKSPWAVPLLLGVWIVSSALTISLTVMRSRSLGEMNEMFFAISSPTSVASALALFLACCVFQARYAGKRLRKIITFSSITSFGVYLAHVLILMIFEQRGIHSTAFTPWLAIPLVSLLLLLLCSAGVKLTQYVPLLRRLVQ